LDLGALTQVRSGVILAPDSRAWEPRLLAGSLGERGVCGIAYAYEYEYAYGDWDEGGRWNRRQDDTAP